MMGGDRGRSGAEGQHTRMATRIEDTVEVEGGPNLLAPPQPSGQGSGSTSTQRVTITANPYAEYVAGSPLWISQRPQALGTAIDDVTATFGDDIYDRMLNDAACIMGLNILKTSILEGGVRIQTAVKDKDDDGFALAAEIADFCTKVFADLETSLSQALWDLLDALAYGNRVAELVYEDDSTYTGKTQTVLRRIKPKPRSATAFVVDSKRNVLGLLGLIPGNNLSLTGFGSTIGDLKEQANLLPRDKFVIVNWRPKSSDPRGTSVLRAAFTGWQLKMKQWDEYEKFLAQFASPVPIGIAGPADQPTPLLTATGDIATYPNGAPIMVTPAQKVLNALQTGYRNGAAIGLAAGADVKTLFNGGEGKSFLNAFDLFNKEIVIAILHQTLGQGSGQAAHSRAATQVHERVTNTIVKESKLDVQWTIRRDMLRLLVLYNYGEKYLRLTPEVTLGETEVQDQAALLTGAAAAGYVFADDQLPSVDALIGVQERDMEAWTAKMEQALELQKQAAAAPATTGGSSGQGGPQDNQGAAQKEAA